MLQDSANDPVEDGRKSIWFPAADAENITWIEPDGLGIRLPGINVVPSALPVGGDQAAQIADLVNTMHRHEVVEGLGGRGKSFALLVKSFALLVMAGGGSDDPGPAAAGAVDWNLDPVDVSTEEGAMDTLVHGVPVPPPRGSRG